MPNLPTFQVSDAQAARLLEVFGSADGYRAWLRDALRTEVRNRKARAMVEKFEADLEAALASEADGVVSAS